MTTFWSLWIIVLTLLTIVLITWLLFATRKIKNDRTDNTTGHVYDGIVEEDNPLPSWWFTMFVLSIVFGLGYLVLYPGMGNYKGTLNWSSASEHDIRLAQVQSKFNDSMSNLNQLDIAGLTAEPKAINMGRRLFANNCAVCHGTTAEGSFGFPNLIDSEWLWGGTDAQLVQTITYGRTGSMPAWKAILSHEQISQLARYITVLSTADDHQDMQALAGASDFKTYCSTCHSADGTGNALLGAPSLADNVWLYGGSSSQITATIAGGRNGQMPAHEGLLSEAKIKLIVAYIRSLAEH